MGAIVDSVVTIYTDHQKDRQHIHWKIKYSITTNNHSGRYAISLRTSDRRELSFRILRNKSSSICRTRTSLGHELNEKTMFDSRLVHCSI